MSDTSANNKRIAKNTMFLYMRMLLILVVTLYTSRVVLQALGETDFGIYNVVGGVITLFTFVSTAMAGATQRYLTFEIGKGDVKKLKETFSASLTIYLGAALLIIFLAETLGMWFLTEKLVIPDDRMTASIGVFQFCILSCVISMLQIPYNADIIAHERMNVFALISIVEVSLKLGIVFLLQLLPIDKLILYAALLSVVQVAVFASYVFYCRRRFDECQMTLCKNRAFMKEMCGFAGWSLFGNMAVVGYTQGLNILLNIFFGPSVNAARGISVQVQSAVHGFVSNFQTALNPQITKKYASNDMEGMHSLLMSSSKLSFYLMLVFAIPLIFLSRQVLELWLVEVPDHTRYFLILSIVIMQINTIANPLTTGVSATGKVKKYQALVGFCQLLIVPFAYVGLELGFVPESVYFVHLGFAVLTQILRVAIVLPMLKMSILNYLYSVVLPILVVSAVTTGLSSLLYVFCPVANVFKLCPVYLLIVAITVYLVGITSSERNLVNLFVSQKISSIYVRFFKN